jgi:hypothetical protein
MVDNALYLSHFVASTCEGGDNFSYALADLSTIMAAVLAGDLNP